MGMNDGWIILGISAFFIATMFSWFWKMMFKVFLLGLIILRWLFIIGLAWGALNCAQFFMTFGWTPMSLMFGDQFYNGRTVGGKTIRTKNGKRYLKNATPKAGSSKKSRIHEI